MIKFSDTQSRWSGDPATYPICADLSRADWLVLHELCQDKTVVEIGAGGSTLMLASIARGLMSYESNRTWFDLVAERLSKQKHRCLTGIALIGEAEPSTLSPPTADVYFIDCYATGRNKWLSWVLRNQAAAKVVIHDSRRDSTLVSLTSLYHCPDALCIDTVSYHANGSNMLVITPRLAPVKYENWNKTETENRQEHLHRTSKPCA